MTSNSKHEPPTPGTASLKQSVIMSARRLARNYAEFPNDPACWFDDLEALWAKVSELDKRLDAEFAKRMA